MLTIRLQRHGRKGHAQFRVVVQDGKLSPASGRIIANVGHYNPHTKEAVVDKTKIEGYLKNGAQPSDRVVRILKAEKVALPAWVTTHERPERTIRNPEKLRANQPAKPVEEAPAEAPVAVEAPAEEPAAADEPVVDEAPVVEEPAVEETLAAETAPVEEAPVEDKPADAPADK